MRNALRGRIATVVKMMRSLPALPSKLDIYYVRFVMQALFVLSPVLRPLLRKLRSKRVIYVGQSYYHTWYLSRELRACGWKADVLNWNNVPEDQNYFHGHDFAFTGSASTSLWRQFNIYLFYTFKYDIFHFSNAHAMHFGHAIHNAVAQIRLRYDEVRLLKALGKVIVYSNNSCNDGVTKSSFAAWSSPPVCDLCNWNNVPAICSDQINREWAEVRNDLADYQCLFGGNRADYNLAPRVHELPHFYCLDPNVWTPTLHVPDQYKIRNDADEVLLYHAVGNFATRTQEGLKNIKSTHVYKPLVEQLQAEGHPVRFVFFDRVPNRELRYYQVQADIFLDMLSFGWFGATGREAMMLGKPVICYLRPSWIEQVRREVPGYVEELPVISATPETVRDILIDLIGNPEKRREIGERSRAFALKWHSSPEAAKTFDRIYSRLLAGQEA